MFKSCCTDSLQICDAQNKADCIEDIGLAGSVLSMHDASVCVRKVLHRVQVRTSPVLSENASVYLPATTLLFD